MLFMVLLLISEQISYLILPVLLCFGSKKNLFFLIHKSTKYLLPYHFSLYYSSDKTFIYFVHNISINIFYLHIMSGQYTSTS